MAYRVVIDYSLIIGNHHLFFLSLLRMGPSILLFQTTRSFAATYASLYVTSSSSAPPPPPLPPTSASSFFSFLLHVLPLPPHHPLPLLLLVLLLLHPSIYFKSPYPDSLLSNAFDRYLSQKANNVG